MTHRRRSRQLLATGFALLLLASLVTASSLPLVQPTRAQTGTPIGSCTTITQPGEYVLTRDIVDSSATACIDIQASDVVLNGDGHTIDGRGALYPASTGVLSRSRTNVTIENLHSTGLTVGVRVLSGSNDVIRSIRADDDSFGFVFRNMTASIVRDTVAMSDGTGISFYNVSNTKLTNIVAVKNDNTGVIFDGITNNTLENVDVVQNRDGVHLTSSTNNTLTDTTVIDNPSGIVFRNSDDNTLTDTTIENGNESLLLAGSDDNTLTNTIASNNIDYGILLANSDNNTLTNTTATNNTNYGITLGGSGNNTLTNTTVTGSRNGVILGFGDSNNRLTNATVSANRNGIYISSSANDTLTRNTITGNANLGIFLTGNAANTLIYDNVLNNTQNVGFGSQSVDETNVWNVSKRPGPNAIGGQYVGGNYYATPTHTGYSQTCVDGNDDGICDVPNRLDRTGNNTDFRPLASPQQISVSPTRLDFRTVQANGTTTANLTVTNTGTSTLTVTNVSIDGANASSFTVGRGGTPVSLAPGESRRVEVRFAPASNGTQQRATLTVASADPVRPTVTVLLRAGVNRQC